MSSEKRSEIRYDEMGKINCTELCSLPGVLDNISAIGIKIHYAFPVVVDLENEYDIQLFPSNSTAASPFSLKCQPLWVKEQDGNTFIGFKTLYSPDLNRFNEFIEHLAQLSQDQLPEIK